MLHREIINKMDTDELRNYLYHLQSYTKIVREINSVRKASEDTLICLLRQQEDLSILVSKENNYINKLVKLTDEMEHKYLSACPSYICEDNTFKVDNKEKGDNK